MPLHMKSPTAGVAEGEFARDDSVGPPNGPMERALLGHPLLSGLTSGEKRQLLQMWNGVRERWSANAVIGHGPDHALNVLLNAIDLNQSEGGHLFVLCASACFVDCGLDPILLHDGHAERSAEIGKEIMSGLRTPPAVVSQVIDAVLAHSSSRPLGSEPAVEALIVRDADLLDRLGYRGVLMTLRYGRHIGRDLNHRMDPLCERRRPQIDTYTLDYVRFLTSLVDRFTLERARHLAVPKVAEVERFLATLDVSKLREGRVTYEDALSIAQGMARVNAASEFAHDLS